jgi:hypothetical protein
MKKLLIVLAAAGFLTACNNSANTTSDKKDSLDSVAKEKKGMIDSTADAKKNAVDSTTQAKEKMLDKKDSAMKHDTAAHK